MAEFVKSATKKSLLGIIKEPLTARSWSRLLEALVTKDELQDYVGSIVDGSAASTKKDLSGYVKRDGTAKLTSNWDAGSYEIRAETLESDVATGTAPLTVASTTMIDNLNADMVDGVEEAKFAYIDGTRDFTGNVTVATGDLYLDDATDPTLYIRTNGSGTIYTSVANLTGSTYINRGDTGACAIFLNPLPGGGGTATAGVFRATNTGGTCEFRVHQGNNTSSLNNFMRGAGDTGLCTTTGNTIIGGTSGASKLTVVGSITLPITTQTATTLTLTSAHHTVLCDTSSNAVTIFLPTAVGISGRIYRIKCIDATNTCTVDGNGTETIDGSLTKTLALNEFIAVQSDNVNWWIVS